jgi:hypothetical protein
MKMEIKTHVGCYSYLRYSEEPRSSNHESTNNEGSFLLLAGNEACGECLFCAMSSLVLTLFIMEGPEL